jgi:hypothetical protein
LSYDDPGRLRISLEFDGVMEPEPMTSVHSTFGKAQHFDQFGKVVGHIELHGERIPIDCIAARDRTWGRRREDRPRKAAYVTGALGPQDSFLAVTKHDAGREGVAYGFLRRDGVTAPLVDGERRAQRNDTAGWVERVELDLVDALGRRERAVGTPLSRMIINRHTFIDMNSLIGWETESGTAWGEDQDMWPVHDWSAARRRGNWS